MRSCACESNTNNPKQMSNKVLACLRKGSAHFFLASSSKARAADSTSGINTSGRKVGMSALNANSKVASKRYDASAVFQRLKVVSTASKTIKSEYPSGSPSSPYRHSTGSRQ